MKQSFLLAILLLACGCEDTGYVPSYIISDTSEAQAPEGQEGIPLSDIPR